MASSPTVAATPGPTDLSAFGYTAMSHTDHDAEGRWLRGGDLEGVHFGPGQRVIVLVGDHAGRGGRIVSLQALAPEPLYVVAIDSGIDDVAVMQSGLQPAS